MMILSCVSAERIRLIAYGRISELDSQATAEMESIATWHSAIQDRQV
jgi:hypothetical protein